MTKYRVRFRRPDGTEAWLGEPGRGAANDPEKSPLLSLKMANNAARIRNQLYSGYHYFPVPQGKKGRKMKIKVAIGLCCELSAAPGNYERIFRCSCLADDTPANRAAILAHQDSHGGLDTVLLVGELDLKTLELMAAPPQERKEP